MRKLKRLGIVAATSALLLAGSPGIASAEPSPGMARAKFHCHVTYSGAFWCHTALT